MATQGKKILLRALPILLLLNSGVNALAADDPWDEAFNEKDTCTHATCIFVQPGAAVIEGGVGLGMLTANGSAGLDAKDYRAQNHMVADPEKLLESNARKVALDELKVKNPGGLALLQEKMDLQILKARGLSAAEASSAHLTERLVALEGRRSELKTLEKEIGTRTGELVAAVKKGREIPKALNDAAHVYSRFKPVSGAQVAIGLGLAIDGGLRGLAILNGNRDPGFAPAVTTGYVTMKKMLSKDPAAPANQGAETGMDIK